MALPFQLDLRGMQMREVSIQGQGSAGVEVQEIVMARARSDDGPERGPEQAERKDGRPGLEWNAAQLRECTRRGGRGYGHSITNRMLG